MEAKSPEVILVPSSSGVVLSQLFIFICTLFCFHLSIQEEGFFRYTLIGIGLGLIGLIVFLGTGSKEAYLKLMPNGMEIKLSSDKVTYFSWEEIEKVQIVPLGKFDVVGLIYTADSNRVSGKTKTINKLLVSGADVMLPTHYPIDLKDLYLLVYSWKLGHQIQVEEIQGQGPSIRASIATHESSLDHKDMDHFGDFGS